MPKRKSLIKGDAAKKATEAASALGGLLKREAVEKIQSRKERRAAILRELDEQGL